MVAILNNDWAAYLDEEFSKPYYIQLRHFLKEEYANQTVYPSMYDIFNALKMTSLTETKVVILGQDPYHGAGQAHGLSFSVRRGIAQPPSLKNIFKEMHDDIGLPIPKHGCLQRWTEQGVLLLNTVLTVREGKPNSHRGKGWETFTDEVIRVVGSRERPVVFLLWGAHAQSKIKLIDPTRGHLIIKSPHPSPLSAHRGFFGSKPFSQANAFLESSGQGAIDWRIEE